MNSSNAQNISGHIQNNSSGINNSELPLHNGIYSSESNSGENMIIPNNHFIEQANNNGNTSNYQSFESQEILNSVIVIYCSIQTTLLFWFKFKNFF